jgi:hypothetical protein
MIELTPDNYQGILDSHFEKDETVFVGISPSPTCEECKANMMTAQSYLEKHPETKLNFYFVNYSKYDILQSYYQFQKMVQYPKIVIFRGNWEDKDFFEGRFTEEQLKTLCKVGGKTV